MANLKLRAFQETLDEAIDSADGELEIAEVIGVMELRLHQLKTAFTTSGESPDSSDWWKAPEGD